MPRRHYDLTTADWVGITYVAFAVGFLVGIFLMKYLK